MKNRKNRKRKLNNKGMTLIEVLVALTLLTVAIMPMLGSFVQVARFSEKGRILQQSTTIAQTAMENCKAYNVEAIHEQMTNSTPTFLTGDYLTGATWSNTTNGDDVTYFINNMNVDNRSIGMSVELSPIATSDKPLTEYENVNGYLDAVFVASSTKADTVDGVNVAAADRKTFFELENEFYETLLDELATEITNKMQTEIGGPLAGVSVSKDELREQYFNVLINSHNQNGLKVSRKISVTASTDISTGVDKAVVTYTYKVEDIENFEYDYGASSFSIAMGNTSAYLGKTATYSATIYSNAVSKDYAGNLERVYLYYYPMYTGYTTDSFRCVSDDVVVDTSGLKYLATGVWKDKTIDVYLIKQLNPDESVITVAEAEEFHHTGGVTVKSGDTAGIRLFHNYKTNLGDGTELTWNLGNGLSITGGACQDIGALTKTQNKKLMYEIQIKMYSNPELNSGVMTGDEILTLDGTKINW